MYSENVTSTLYLPGVVNSSYLHIFFKGSCWLISFWQKLLCIWKCTYLFLSAFPPLSVSLWTASSPSSWSRLELVALTSPLTSPAPGSLRSSCKYAVAFQICMRVDLTWGAYTQVWSFQNSSSSGLSASQCSWPRIRCVCLWLLLSFLNPNVYWYHGSKNWRLSHPLFVLSFKFVNSWPRVKKKRKSTVNWRQPDGSNGIKYLHIQNPAIWLPHKQEYLYKILSSVRYPSKNGWHSDHMNMYISTHPISCC